MADLVFEKTGSPAPNDPVAPIKTSKVDMMWPISKCRAQHAAPQVTTDQRGMPSSYITVARDNTCGTLDWRMNCTGQANGGGRSAVGCCMLGAAQGRSCAGEGMHDLDPLLLKKHQVKP